MPLAEGWLRERERKRNEMQPRHSALGRGAPLRSVTDLGGLGDFPRRRIYRWFVPHRRGNGMRVGSCQIGGSQGRTTQERAVNGEIPDREVRGQDGC